MCLAGCVFPARSERGNEPEETRADKPKNNAKAFAAWRIFQTCETRAIF